MYRILLVQSPWSAGNTPIMPLSLLVLGARLQELREEGLEFEVFLEDLDFALKRGELQDAPDFYARAAERLHQVGADAYLFTTHGPNESIVLQVARELKARDPGCLTVVGGVVATLQGRRYIEHFPQIDLVIRGEGEPALAALVRAAMTDRDFSKVPSAVGRHDGAIFENRRVHVPKRGGFLFPDYDLVDLEAYAHHSTRHPYLFPGFTPVESGRGCANRCSFCGPAQMWNRRVRTRAVSEIIDEMRFVASHGFRFVFFTQDNIEEAFLVRLCRALLRSDVRVRWGCYARLYSLTDDTLRLMARAGCCHIFVGFEASEPEIHAFINKEIPREESIFKAAVCRDLGIKLIGSFVACAPGESLQQFQSALDFALECAVGMPAAELRELVRPRVPDTLPRALTHQCVVNPLACTPGTDFHDVYGDQLRFVDASTNEEGYGSHLFGPNDFVREHWRVVSNACASPLSEDEFALKYPALRIYNAFLLYPYLLAWLLVLSNTTTLELIREVSDVLGGDRVLRATPAEFERSLLRLVQERWGGCGPTPGGPIR